MNLFANARAASPFPTSIGKISLHFPAKQGNRSGEGFADDCPHRQLVPYFYREIPPSEIITTVPRVSPAKVDVNGRRERSLENGAALWVANSPLGSSAVRLGAAEITTHHRELVACT